MEEQEKIEAEVTEEEITPENTEEYQPEVISPSDYKLLNEMMNEMDDQYKMLRESVISTLDSYHLTESALDTIMLYSKETIEHMSRADMIEFFSSNTKLEKEDFPLWEKEQTDDDLREILVIVKDSSILYYSTRDDVANFKNSYKDIVNQYLTYISSEKVTEDRKSRLETMKSAYELETSPMKKNQMQRMIQTMEAAMDFSFLKARLETFAEKEVDSIMTGYFDKAKGTYVIEKFESRIAQYGYRPDVYKFFFNLEETFLPEEYHPFNNLFLFIYMRFVAYSNANDKNDKMLVRAATGAIANLVYQKFSNEDEQDVFLQVMQDIVGKFMDKKTYFEENNTTYKKNPARIKMEQAANQKRIAALLKRLEQMKIDVPEKETKTADELQKIYDEEIEKLIKKQNKEEEEPVNIEGASNVEVDEDGIVNITPTVQPHNNDETEEASVMQFSPA